MFQEKETRIKQSSVKAKVGHLLPGKKIEHRRAIIAQNTTPTPIFSISVRPMPFQNAEPKK